MEEHEKYSLLKRLQDGEEKCWDSVYECVGRNEISRVNALNALEKCLRKTIPYYQSCIATLERAPSGEEGFNYWNDKMKEALRAKKMIKDAKKGRERIITYRGRSV